MHDKPGRYLYIKDMDTGEYWSATHQPIKRSDKYEAIHGLGYTKISTTYMNISSEITYFVPINENCELWFIKIKNDSKKRRNLKVFPFIEWLLGDWFSELEIRNISILYNEGHWDKKNQAITATKFPFGNVPWEYNCFAATSLDVVGFDVDFEKFIGRYRSYENPQVLEKGSCNNSDNVRGMNLVGVLESEIILDQGEDIEFSVIIGINKKDKSYNKIIQRSRNLKEVKQLLKQTKEYWQKAILDNIKISTPDTDLDSLVNVWSKYQIYMCNHWGRSATFYHEGNGDFGYRNTAQDAFGILSLNADFTRERMLKLAYHQRATGQCMAGWSNVTGPSLNRPASDFPAWLPFLINDYVKETGNFDILRQDVPYFDKGSSSLYDHGLQAMRFLQDIDKGEHGLPLMGTQDWNDALDRVGIKGRGESVMLAMQVCWGLKNLKEIAEYLGDEKVVAECNDRYEAMKKTINETAWDGNWYLMAYDDEMNPLGTKKNKECQVYLNTQSFAIISGIVEKGKLEKILSTVKVLFADPYGPPLFVPYYSNYNENIGRITAFAPGTKENAAIFCHAAIFMAYAYLSINMPDEAYDIINKISPLRSVGNMELFKTEPYIFPEYITGPGNTRYGEGAFTWLTGTCDWFFVAVTQLMLGVKPEYNGLRISPCLPKKWKKAKIERNFRGNKYLIEINRGKEDKVIVNNQLISNSIINEQGLGKSIQVKVVLK